MKALYASSRVFQWTVALLFLTALVALIGIATAGATWALGLQVEAPAQLAFGMAVPLVAFLPLWMLISLFLLAPLFRVTGVLRYCSPYLIVARSGRHRIDLHGATPFDYLLLFRWRDRGRPAVRAILLWYIEGLITLAHDIERGHYPTDTTISATSYIFSSHTARRYGFDVVEAPRFAWGGLLTYPTQFLTYSFARGRWAFPPILGAKRATISGANLCSQIAHLERVQKRLRDAPDTSSRIVK